MQKRKNMEDKNLNYIVLGIIILLLIGILFVNLNKINGKAIKESNNELEKYRSMKIPEQCRLPEYEDNLESWKEHLSHHENTLSCLDYYK